jgi:hypothetical protein
MLLKVKVRGNGRSGQKLLHCKFVSHDRVSNTSLNDQDEIRLGGETF